MQISFKYLSSKIFQDYEDFETANEDDQLSVFLKLDNADKGNGVTSQVSWKRIFYNFIFDSVNYAF